MRIAKIIKYIFIVLVLISTFSYTLLAESSPILSFIFSIVMLIGILIFEKDRRITHRTSLSLSIFFTIYFLIDISLISRNLLFSGNHLLMLLTFHRLITLKNEKDYLLILLFSFLTIASSGSVNPNLPFLLLFFFFIFLSIFSLTLISLYKGNFRIKERVLKSLIKISLISTLTIFLASPAIFFTVPRLGIGIGTLMGSSPPLISGFSENVHLGDIGTIIENNRVVMRVKTADLSELPPDHLWRGKGYNYFDGKGWSSTIITSKGTEIKRRYKEKKTIAIINLEPLGTDVLFLPYNLEWIRGIRTIKEDANGTISSPFGAYTKRNYTVEFVNFSSKLIPYEERDLKPYLQLPEFNMKIYNLAKEIAGNLKDHESISKKVEEFLKKEFKYSLNLASSSSPIEDFLFKRKEGHCEYFSSAMAVLLRHLEIPARVVNGFKRGDFNSTGGYYVVREKDAHSWVEVYIEGKGWVAFDPTPSISTGYKRNILIALRDVWDAIQFWWDRNFVTYSPQKQISFYFGFYEAFRKLISKLEKFKYYYIVLLFSAFSSIIIFIFLKRKKKRVKKEDEEEEYTPKRVPPVEFYNRFLKIVKLKGFSIYDSETPLEFMERIKNNFDETEGLYIITKSYYSVRYGERKLKKEDIIRIENVLKKLKEKR